MAKGKQHGESPEPKPANALPAKIAGESQLDFELKFFGDILERHPDYVDVLRQMANLLTLKGMIREGLQVDQRLVRLRPEDPLAHYNLACSYSLLKKADSALKTLRVAVELGYRDFRYMRDDRDLDFIREDPRYRQLLREFESR